MGGFGTPLCEGEQAREQDLRVVLNDIARGPGDVGGQGDIRHLQERAARRERLIRKDIEPGPRQSPCLKSPGQGRVVEDARGVQC